MNARIVNKDYALSTMRSLIILMILSLFILNLNAYGAPYPRKSDSELRTEADVYFEQGQRLQDMGKYKEAAQKYERAIKVDRKYAEAWSNLGYTLRKRGKFDLAEKELKILRDLGSDEADELEEFINKMKAEKS